MNTLIELIQELAEREVKEDYENRIRSLEYECKRLSEDRQAIEKSIMASFMQSSRIKSVTQKTDTLGVARSLEVIAVFRGPDGIEITVA